MIRTVQITLLVTLTLNLALGFFVLMTHPRRAPNRMFFMVSLALAAWLLSVLFITTATTAGGAAFWIRLANAAALLIPLFGQLLRQAIVNQVQGWRSQLQRHGIMVLTSLTIATLCQTRVFLREVIMPASGTGFPYAVYGPALYIFASYYLGAWLLLLVQLIRDARCTTGMIRAELYFVLLSLPTALIIGLVFAVVLPWLTGNFLYAALAPLVLVFPTASMAYGIATRRIMEATDVLRRVTAYALLTGYLVLLYLAVWFPVARLLLRVPGLSVVPGVAAALTVAFSMAPAYGRLQRFSDRLFINARPLDVGTVMQRTNQILDSISTLTELLRRFGRSICQAVGTDRIFILLMGRDGYEQQYPEPGESPPVRLAPEEALIRALKTQRGPISEDAIERMRASGGLTEAARRLRELKAAIAVFIHSKGGQEGVLLLGPRLSGRIYGAVEQDTLQILCNQLAVALENARLYTQVQNSMIYNEILLDNLVSGVIAANVERLVTVFNREAQRITRLDPAAVLNRPVSILPEPLMKALEMTFERDLGQRDKDVVLTHGPGEETPIRLGSSIFHGYTGDVLGALLVFNDLTALRRLEMQVRRTDRLASLGTLTAGMAHEIKNPLVSIKTFTQLLPERYGDPDFRETFSSLVGQGVKRIDTIVNQLLNFSRPARPHLVSTHLHKVLDASLQLLDQQARQKGIRIVRRFDASPDLVRADVDQLNQAFINFLLNGIEAMNNDDGVLTVSTEVLEAAPFDGQTWDDPGACKHHLRVSIGDTGEGIPQENLARVFDPFFTTKSHGTGLGLSVAHGIIQEHGGITDLVSEVGKGTIFYLYFPLMAKEEVAA